MKVYTKTGDDGKTSLIGGERVFKYDLRLESYGTVDELNAQLGVLGTQVPAEFSPYLTRIQNELFHIGSLLASPNPEEFGLTDLPTSCIVRLEDEMDAFSENLPKLTNFILPGGSQASAIAHVCRCVCRRAERRVVALSSEEDISEVLIKYLNRLSDWFFVFARFANHRAGIKDVIWEGI